MAARYGSEIYTIDHKGRVSVPVALRRASARRSREVYLTLGFEGCIVMYDAEQWKAFESRLNTIPYGDEEGRAFARLFFDATVGPLVPDTQGRIGIPQHLLHSAGLTKEAKFLPMGDRIEIWDPERYREASAPARVDLKKAGARWFGGGASS
jgi:MraZ protein